MLRPSQEVVRGARQARQSRPGGARAARGHGHAALAVPPARRRAHELPVRVGRGRREVGALQLHRHRRARDVPRARPRRRVGSEGASTRIARVEGDPLEFLRAQAGGAAPGARSRAIALPRFLGGAVGMVSYDWVRFVERVPDANPDETEHARSVVRAAGDDRRLRQRAQDRARSCATSRSAPGDDVAGALPARRRRARGGGARGCARRCRPRTGGAPVRAPMELAPQHRRARRSTRS